MAVEGFFLLKFLERTPFAMLGALGLVGLASNVVELNGYIATWIDVWVTITRPVWEFSIGQIIDISDWMKDYLTTGVIAGAMFYRALKFRSEFRELREFGGLGTILFMNLVLWPFTLASMVFITVHITRESEERDREIADIKNSLEDEALTPEIREMEKSNLDMLQQARFSHHVFWETAVYAAIVLAISFFVLGD